MTAAKLTSQPLPNRVARFRDLKTAAISKTDKDNQAYNTIFGKPLQRFPKMVIYISFRDNRGKVFATVESGNSAA